MKKEDLIKGNWYLTKNDFFIRFDYLKGHEIWVSEYYNQYNQHTIHSGFTTSDIVREANAKDALKRPRILETYNAIANNGNSPITNYEIY